MENEEDRALGQIENLEHQELQSAEKDLTASRLAKIKSEDDLRKQEERGKFLKKIVIVAAIIFLIDRHEEVIEQHKLDKLQREVRN